MLGIDLQIYGSCPSGKDGLISFCTLRCRHYFLFSDIHPYEGRKTEKIIGKSGKSGYFSLLQKVILYLGETSHISAVFEWMFEASEPLIWCFSSRSIKEDNNPEVRKLNILLFFWISYMYRIKYDHNHHISPNISPLKDTMSFYNH